MQAGRRKNDCSLPFCSLFCYLLFAAASNAYQRPDKNCQWFCCFTDNSSVFVQGALTHQGSLLCCLCCEALKRLCLCCKALKGESLNLCKYAVVVQTFDFDRARKKKTLRATVPGSIKGFFFSNCKSRFFWNHAHMWTCEKWLLTLVGYFCVWSHVLRNLREWFLRGSLTLSQHLNDGEQQHYYF